MARKNIQFILKSYIAALRKGKSGGFTLIELLMAMVVGSIVVYGMLSLVVNLLETDKRETAKSQTQEEMGQALDYIAAELQEAVYIYESDCLTTGRTGTIPCPGLVNEIDFPTDVKPVLAFWKVEQVPYRTTPTEKNQNLPDDCTKVATNRKGECELLMLSRNTYTLVVYGLQKDEDKTDEDKTWEGPARITRFELRKYDPEKLSPELEQTKGYKDPPISNFGDWKRCTTSGTDYCATLTGKIPFNNNVVLVDLVDDPDKSPAAQDCPTDYSATPPSNPASSKAAEGSFYACVKTPSLGTMQDAIVFLRGNAAKRAGQEKSRDPAYLPSQQRQVQARSVFQREPPQP